MCVGASLRFSTLSLRFRSSSVPILNSLRHNLQSPSKRRSPQPVTPSKRQFCLHMSHACLTGNVPKFVLCNMNIQSLVLGESLLQRNVLTLVKLVLDGAAERGAFVKTLVVCDVVSGTLVSVQERNIIVVQILLGSCGLEKKSGMGMWRGKHTDWGEFIGLSGFSHDCSEMYVRRQKFVFCLTSLDGGKMSRGAGARLRDISHGKMSRPPSPNNVTPSAPVLARLKQCHASMESWGYQPHYQADQIRASAVPRRHPVQVLLSPRD